MNNRSFDDGLTYFFSQRIHGRDVSNNLLGLAEPESEWERTESVIADILRWADDGGKMLDPVENRTAGSNPDVAQEQRNK